MHGYMLAIMAVCLAGALALWLALVFMAGRNPSRRPQQNWPHREVVGGTFEASRGGRQVMPDPTESIVREPGPSADTGSSADTGPRGEAGVSAQGRVPGQREEPGVERAPADQPRRS